MEAQFFSDEKTAYEEEKGMILFWGNKNVFACISTVLMHASFRKVYYSFFKDGIQ